MRMVHGENKLNSRGEVNIPEYIEKQIWSRLYCVKWLLQNCCEYVDLLDMSSIPNFFISCVLWSSYFNERYLQPVRFRVKIGMLTVSMGNEI